jgi:hypothetical protein
MWIDEYDVDRRSLPARGRKENETERKEKKRKEKGSEKKEAETRFCGLRDLGR